MTAIRPMTLVTGASSGIGKPGAPALHVAGFRGDRNKPGQLAAHPRRRGEVRGPRRDARRVGQRCGRVGDRAVRARRLDVLVNNAGIGTNGAAEEISVAQAQGFFDVNVSSLMRLTKAVLPHVRAHRRGRVITSHPRAGSSPRRFMAGYVASKHAVEGYSESVDHEVREHGVRVLLVEPGPTTTPFDANMVQADGPLPVYAHQRRIFDDVAAASMRAGDGPAVDAKVIVTAATEPKPKLRFTAGPTAGRVSALRRAYRRLGPDTRVPVIFLNHLTGNLDNWDPRVVDGIAARHRVITFDAPGASARRRARHRFRWRTWRTTPSPSSGRSASTRSICLGFSLGGFVAQVIALEEPKLLRKIILTGDAMVPSSNSTDLARGLPNAELVLYQDAGHGGIFQYHDEFVPRALECLGS
jgi:short-subunit dehydrogenase